MTKFKVRSTPAAGFDNHRSFVVTTDPDDPTIPDIIIGRVDTWNHASNRPRFHIVHCGPGIPPADVDTTTTYPSAAAAASAIVAVRAAHPATHTDHTGLTGLERTILDLAAQHLPGAGFLSAASTYHRLHLTPTRAAQLLIGLIDRPEAAAYNPDGVRAAHIALERGRARHWTTPREARAAAAAAARQTPEGAP